MTTRPARRPRSRAVPAKLVLNRSVTRNRVPARLTFGGPRAVSVDEPPLENEAVTLSARLIVTVHVVLTPVQAPPQPVNLKTTVEFAATFAVQDVAPLPQRIAPPVTSPCPVTETDSGKLVATENVAPTLFAPVIATLQVGAVPVHAPVQPVKVEPLTGDSPSVTVVPTGSCAVHVVAPLPQLMPPPVTTPGPSTATVSGAVEPTPPVKVAATLFEPFIRIVQLIAVPPQAPLQPVKTAPVAGVAVSVTDWFSTKLAEQEVPLLPQLMAPAPPLTLPLPLTKTVSCGAGAKVAPTVSLSVIVTEHAGTVPEHAPVQPVKTKPSLAVAVSVTVEFRGTEAAQVGGQPIGPPLTAPPPETETVSRRVSVELAQAAFTDWSPLSKTVQATLVPLQAPLHPEKTFPSVGCSSTVSVEPVSTLRLQSVPPDSPQLMPPPITSPPSVCVTDRVLTVVGGPLKFAVIS